MKSSLGHIAFALATALCSLQSADAQLAEPKSAEPKLPDRVGWQPRTFSCAETSAKLVFTKQDFEKGFNRFYTFPNVTECDGYEPGVSDFRERGGSLRLTYDPKARDPMTAEVRYRERYACDEGKGMAEHSFEWFGSLQPVDEDPDGIFPAAGFDSGMEKPAKFTYRPCGDLGKGGPHPWISVYLGLVYQDDATGELVRKPFLQLDGGPSGAGDVAFGPVPESPDEESALTVAGCLHRAIGTFEYVTAQGRPPGGSYRWTSEPSSIFGIDGADERAIVTAEQAGHATLQVQYETPEGNHLFESLAGSVVDLRSVNNGAAIPEIGLKDENGKDALPIRVPIDQDPPDGGLLRFESEDPGIATLYNEGTTLLIQGANPGSTTAQAQTSCGDTVGPVIAINVVKCTQETIGRLRAKEDAIRAEQTAQAQKVIDMLSDPEVQRANGEFKRHLADALLKAGEVLAVGASAAAHGVAALQAIESFITGMNMGLLAGGASVGHTKDLMLLSLMFTPYAPFVVDYEIYHAWSLLIGDVSTLKTLDQQLQDVKAEFDRLGQELKKQEERRFEICGRDDVPGPKKKDPPPPPKAEPPLRQDEPTPKVVPADEGQETAVGEEPEPPPVNPPPPEPPPPVTKSGGFSLEKCGCDSFNRAAWTTGANGLGSIGVDLGVAESCGNAMTQHFSALEAAMRRLGGAGNEIQRALSLPEAESIPLLEAASNEIRDATTSLGSITQTASAISESFQSCNSAIPEAVSLMKESASEMAEITK